MQDRSDDVYNRLGYTYLNAMGAQKHVRVAKKLLSSFRNET